MVVDAVGAAHEAAYFPLFVVRIFTTTAPIVHHFLANMCVLAAEISRLTSFVGRAERRRSVAAVVARLAFVELSVVVLLTISDLAAFFRTSIQIMEDSVERVLMNMCLAPLAMLQADHPRTIGGAALDQWAHSHLTDHLDVDMVVIRPDGPTPHKLVTEILGTCDGGNGALLSSTSGAERAIVTAIDWMDKERRVELAASFTRGTCGCCTLR